MSSFKMLSLQDSRLVRLYMTACFSQWEGLAPIAKEFYAAGGTVAEIRGCVRHLIVLAGYGPCLAAMLALQKAKLLPEDAPAKVSGAPGDAFELVYGSVTDAVRRKVHSSDPPLGEWIRLHLYGDVYSSPGIDLRRKQILMCARLAEANMQDQLFGHAIAAMRFGGSKDQLNEAVALAFELCPVQKEAVHKASRKTLDMAAAKYNKDFAAATPFSPEIHIPDPACVRVPQLYKPGSEAAAAPIKATLPAPEPAAVTSSASKLAGKQDAADQPEDDNIIFAWEEVDPRFDQGTKKWRS